MKVEREEQHDERGGRRPARASAGRRTSRSGGYGLPAASAGARRSRQRAVDRHSRSPWICSSTRARSCSGGSASRSRPAGSQRAPRRRARRRGELGGQVVVKAQVLTGGRGKAGGVKLAADPDEAAARAAEILGLDIRGPCRRPALDRVGLRDRARVLPLGHARPRGGPGAADVHDAGRGRDRAGRGREPRGARRACMSTRSRGSSPIICASCSPGVEAPGERAQIEQIAASLYRCFVESDATLCEINPLIVTPGGRGARARREGDDRRLGALAPSGARRAARHLRAATRSRPSRASAA